MAIDIVDLSIEHGGPFHSFLYVYQRVYVITKICHHQRHWGTRPMAGHWPRSVDHVFVGLTHIDILFTYYSLYIYVYIYILNILIVFLSFLNLNYDLYKNRSIHILIYPYILFVFSTAICSSCRTTRQQQLSASHGETRWKKRKIERTGESVAAG